MEDFKTKGAGEAKVKTGPMKIGTGELKTGANSGIGDGAGFTVKKRDVIAYHGKIKVKKDFARFKRFGVKAAQVGGGYVFGQSDNDAFDTTNADILKSLARGAGKPAGFAAGGVRGAIERKLLKGRVDAPITTRTAFSLFKTRRNMYDSAYVKAQNAKRIVAMKKQAAKVKSTAKMTGRGVGFVANKVLRVVAEATKLIGSTLIALVAAAGSFLVPVIAVVVVVVLLVSVIVANNSGGDLVFATATGRATSTGVNITIYIDETLGNDVPKDGEGVEEVGPKKLLKFSSSYQEGRIKRKFTYRGGQGANGKTRITGRIIGNKITMAGLIDGEEIALEGTVSGGMIAAEGYYGFGAEGALNGEWKNPFGRTKYTMTSAFGYRVHPITGEWKYHDGYDICAATGVNTPVYASVSGKVTVAGSYGGYGNCVVINHGDGIQSVYGHLNAVTVRAGTKVKTGQQIGTEGNTGVSSGAHLHFEVRKKGKAVDASKYLKTVYADATNGKEWRL